MLHTQRMLKRTAKGYTEEDIERYVEAQGCLFLSTHIGANHLRFVTYICSCHGDGDGIVTPTTTQWTYFRRSGTRCDDCAVTRKNQTQASRSDEIKQRSIEKRGVEHHMLDPVVREKWINTLQEKYGVDHPSRMQDFQAKHSQTSREHFGTDHPSQSSEVQKRIMSSAYGKKDMVIDGKLFRYRGYEHFAIKRLVDQGITVGDILFEDEIIQSPLPEFWYTLDGKEHRYFPDIYDRKNQRIIEVKSEYTESINPGELTAKIQAVINRGINLELWVFDGKGEIQKIEKHSR